MKITIEIPDSNFLVVEQKCADLDLNLEKLIQLKLSELFLCDRNRIKIILNNDCLLFILQNYDNLKKEIKNEIKQDFLD